MVYEWYNQTKQDYARNPGTMRFGQALMNALYQERPQLYRQVSGTPADPFYEDSRVPAFITWLTDHWN